MEAYLGDKFYNKNMKNNKKELYVWRYWVVYLLNKQRSNDSNHDNLAQEPLIINLCSLIAAQKVVLKNERTASYQ